MSDFILDGLLKIVQKDNVLKDEPMKNRCTFKTGGNASYFVMPENASQVADTIKFAKDNNIKYFVIGNGSNLLVSDDGYDGIIICIGKNMSDIKVEGTKITASAGATLAKVASVALKNSLCGFEFASGIPGTIGGAVYMNAGAYGGEMKQVVTKTTYIDNDGNIKQVEGDNHLFGYRTSVFKNGGIVVECEIQLQKGIDSEIQALMTDFNNRRKEKQPLEYPSAGSTFKRPEGHFAGKLIEDAGLKGYRFGGAMVSEKHAGFVINYDNATATDILNVMDHVKKEVYMRFGVELEPEVKIVGEE